MVQQLSLYAASAGGHGFNPWSRTKVLHVLGVVKKIFLMKCSRSCNCISMFEARLKYTCQGFAGAIEPSIFREWPVLHN